jgi:hypothetical protein
MTAPRATPRRLYELWVEEQLEEYKSALTRDELLAVADAAVEQLFDSPDGQYSLTEMLLCDAVDALLFRRLNLPDFRAWSKSRRYDTARRPAEGTPEGAVAAS